MIVETVTRDRWLDVLTAEELAAEAEREALAAQRGGLDRVMRLVRRWLGIAVDPVQQRIYSSALD